MNSVQDSVKEIEKSQQLNLFAPANALPRQVKLNKAILGVINTKVSASGSESGYGKSTKQLNYVVQNSGSINLDECYLAGKTKWFGGANGTNTKLAGVHRLLRAFKLMLNDKVLVDIQDRCGELYDLIQRTTLNSDQLNVFKSMVLQDVATDSEADASGVENGGLSFKIPLGPLVGNLSNLISTAMTDSTLRFTFQFQDTGTGVNGGMQYLSSGTGATTTVGSISVISLNNMVLEANYYDLSAQMKQKLVERMQSKTGMLLPYYSYYIDERLLDTGLTNVNVRVPIPAVNLLSTFTAPAYRLKADTDDASRGADRYAQLTWQGTAQTRTQADAITKFLVNFDGSIYYNLNSNDGQNNMASHTQALEVASKIDSSPYGAGSAVMSEWNNYQVLACSFERVKGSSVDIIDSGVNARLYGQNLNVSFILDQATIANTSLLTVSRYTRKLTYANGDVNIDV